MTVATPKVSCGQALRAVADPRIYKNFAIHLFVLLPASLVLAWLGTRVDAHLGWGAVTSRPVGWALAAICLATGAAIVVYSYAYLLLVGEGSPGSHLGGPQRLVTSGPYALVRHPSVIGKLLGVIAVGLAVGSPSFLLGVVPFLLAYSLVTNRFLQERYCERAFGESYRRYRARVPMIVPRPRALAAWWRGEAVLEEVTAEAEPGSIPRYELAIYLAFLAAILAAAFLLVRFITG
jgi:protein-S-isoprenylcysteine O-methyltransferase Ste14